MGIDIQQDVGIPSRLIGDLRSRFQLEDMDFDSIHVGGLDLLEYINGYKSVIFIDTIKTDQRIPGKVHYFSLDNYRETLHLSCRHDLTFEMTLKLGERLNFKIPEIIRVIAIEILEDLEFGPELSTELDDKYTQIRSEVEKYVDGYYKEMQI